MASPPTAQHGSSAPRNQVTSVLRQHEALASETPEPFSVVTIGNRQDVVQSLCLMGIFPTPEWQDDPTMPEFMSQHQFKIGYYQVSKCVLVDGAGNAEKLVLVVNVGDGDCNTGFWGGCFCSRENGESLEPIARIYSTGDMETTVEEAENHGMNFVTHESLKFPEYKDTEEEGDDDCRESYFSGLSPGFCESQLEKIIGGILDHLRNNSHKWKQLPKALRNYGELR